MAKVQWNPRAIIREAESRLRRVKCPSCGRSLPVQIGISTERFPDLLVSVEIPNHESPSSDTCKPMEFYTTIGERVIACPHSNLHQIVVETVDTLTDELQRAANR